MDNNMVYPLFTMLMVYIILITYTNIVTARNNKQKYVKGVLQWACQILMLN